MKKELFRENILQFNAQLGYRGLELKNLGKLKKRPDAIVVVGMGGSGLAGEIIKYAADELGLSVPVVIWRDYSLPNLERAAASKKPLYIFVSFSGSTEETVSGLVRILKTNPRANVAVIATGGDLVKIANRYGLPFVGFRAGSLTPRQAVGRMFYAVIELLHASLAIPRKAKAFTNLTPSAYEKSGANLAAALKGRVVCVYTDEGYRDAGYIWKIKLNETAKMLAFHNVLPEMNHNEIVGFEKSPRNVAALFFAHPGLAPRLRKRLRLTERLVRSRGVRTLLLRLTGKSKLEQVWRTLVLADWTTYYLARFGRVDPAATRVIDTLKKLMR